MRKAFIPQEKDWVILSADYSQVELRIMANYSHEPELIKAFETDSDIHRRTAALVNGINESEVTSDQRRSAKVVNFGIMYGAGPYRMSQELGISMSDAKILIDTYFNRYIGIRNYMDKTIQNAEKQKFVETVLGRRRNIWNIDSENHMQKEAAKRMAINMPIQGTAAEMIKLAMLDINRTLQNENYQTRMILQIHDELLFESPKNEIDKLEEMVIDKMVNAMPLIVPLVVDCGKGISWLDAH